jgi:uncharacterized cupredoxin-like copper-binding protein
MKGRLPIALAVLIVVLAACGGDDGPSAEAQTDITVEMSDFAFDPRQVLVPPGAEITVTVDNVGSVEHNWIVLQEGIQIEAEADIPDDRSGFELEKTGLVDAGGSSSVTFTAPESGIYQIICDVPGHFTAGMEGRLRVDS